jgi:hypothetical protein
LPGFQSNATRIATATSTQNSGSLKRRNIRRSGHRLRVGRPADELLGECRGNLGGDRGDFGECPLLGRGDVALGRTGARGKRARQFLLAGGRCRFEPLAGFADRRLGCGPRLGERALVSGDDRLRLRLQFRRAGEVAVEPRTPGVESGTDARQRHPLHQQE